MADLPSGTAPAVTHSIHRDFLKQASPAWLVNATAQSRARVKDATATLPGWYQQASALQRQALQQKFTASFAAQTMLDKAMAALQDIDTFAAPLLQKALKDQFQLDLDVNSTFIRLKKPVEVGLFAIEIGSFVVLHLPLLQAALHNFEARECEDDAFHHSSGFLTQAPSGLKALDTSLTVTQFTRLCRSLDVGAKYQAYLKSALLPADPLAGQLISLAFVNAHKTAFAAAAERALLSKDIEPADYTLLQAVINDQFDPRQGNKQVWFRDLGLMNKRMTGCVVFVISEKYRYSDELLLYIPNDPQHPLKRYTPAQMQAMFKSRFTARDPGDSVDGNPTRYQRFFSQFVAYADLPEYFAQLTEEAPAHSMGEALLPYALLINKLLQGLNPFKVFTEVNELPPTPPRVREANPEPFLAPVDLSREGHGLWADNIDLWQYQFEQHRNKLIADARSHAVPTADVDARVRSEKFARLLNIGFLVLNTVSMFVPVLGEVMMVVMAGKLLQGTLEGVIEWSEGDRMAAKAHLVDVAENLAMLVVMAGVGQGFGKLVAAKTEPLIERLDPVTLPGGQARLWRPALSGYETPDTLPVDVVPNPKGQYRHNGKTYIRQAGATYEKTFDETLQRWRVKHPTDPNAYQPPLTHNNAGAWRLTHERPQSWDRLTLLRRMGHVTEGFSDEQLLSIGDISGAGDDTLRKMHLDNARPPPELADALRLFRADQEVAQVIEQVGTEKAVDGRYLYVLPLITELPRWPAGRTLKVFDGPGFTGRSRLYGVERLGPNIKSKPAIRISRTDILSSRLSAHILAALDESEIVGLLGGEPARVYESRPQEFRKQIVDYARTRQPALFDSLYTGVEHKAPAVAKLQRLYPGLSEPAAQTLLAEADATELNQLRDTGRVPLGMQERARWYVRQGRLGHAYAGLHMENLTSAASKRLALHTLERLPGWSDEVRLEVREGSIEGALLDSIGSETATQRKYLVKKGPLFQAFNDRGETLNSVPRFGDNFYASIMHALPDEVREAMGIPHVGQSLDLRRAIIEYASEHRLESARIVDEASRGQAWFKPPQRISPTLIGYPASGRGEGMMATLVSRVQVVYPQLTDEQANGFILRRMVEDEDEAQIYSLLNNRLREWQALESTLVNWVANEPVGPSAHLFSAIGGKRQAAEAIKACWRNSPLAELPRFAELNLFVDEPLPLLSADFSHVRILSLGGQGITDATIGRVLEGFDQVETLRLAVSTPRLSGVPVALETLPQLTSLRVVSSFPMGPAEVQRLGGLTRLQHLTLDGPLTASSVLDVSRLVELRSLAITRSIQAVFPTGVFELPHVERLDLRGSIIGSLPAEFFEAGGERYWSGLSLDWSRFTREHFKPAYDYVRGHPRHLMDLEEMVVGYSKGELSRFYWPGGEAMDFTSVGAQRNALFTAFFERWSGHSARFEAVEALSAEHDALSQLLGAWSRGSDAPMEGLRRSNIIFTLKACWYQGLLGRYGLAGGSRSLSLRSVMVSELPILPATGFAHVDTLQLASSRVPFAQLRAFVGGFSQLRRLDVSDCALSQLPVMPGGLTSLEHLNLGKNLIETVDVSAMAQLQSLNLSGSALRVWPQGVEGLPRLTWLDLRDSQITHVPESALSHDALLMATNLTGVPLTDAAQAQWNSALLRVEHTRGLSPGTLNRFALELVPEEFPPTETGVSVASRLLPLLPVDPVGVVLSAEQRLQRLSPQLSADRVASWAEHLRGQNINDVQVHQQIGEWEQSFDALTRSLNGWLFIREAHGTGWRVSSQTRRWVALRIVEAWRNGWLVWEGSVQRVLNFEGVQVGDLPGLPAALAHIETLDLTGVRLSEEGSNSFLGAFPGLRTLVLNANLLVELPSAVERMTQLERLELSANQLMTPAPLYTALQNLQQLRWLDLSHCNLQTFRADVFTRIETLDLRNNRLVEWPEGVLQIPSLRTLNLRVNEIEGILPQALEGNHDALMAGTDITDNNLSREDIVRLQAYAERTGRTPALGYSGRELEQLLEDFDSGDTSTQSAEENLSDIEPDEPLEPNEAGAQQRAPWFRAMVPEVLAEREALWDQLSAEPDNAAFFHLLRLLQDTTDFRVVRADLTRRVWAVLSAAGVNTELRQTLFAMSNTHGTCIDGRILTFSGLEVKVFEHNTLLGIDPARLDLKGAALLKLSRQLFRLEKVEALAARATGVNADAAEVRLEYRIGLKDKLDLPGQPEHMAFGRPLAGTRMAGVEREVLAAEQRDEFYENLISRDYWVDYLKQKYPAQFEAMQARRDAKWERFESAHQQFDDAYAQGLNNLEIELETDRTQSLLVLSRSEVQAQAADQPGPSRAMNRPASR